jgi:hypothetical protein
MKGGLTVRLVAIGLGIAVIVFVLTAGHVVFLPLLSCRLVCSRLGTVGDGSRARLLDAMTAGRGDLVVPVTSVPSVSRSP